MFRKTLAAATLALVFSVTAQAAPLSFQSKTLEAKSCDGKNSEGPPLPSTYRQLSDYGRQTFG